MRALMTPTQLLVQVFPRADVKSFRLLQNPPSVPKNIILVDQDIAYYRDPNGVPTKVQHTTFFACASLTGQRGACGLRPSTHC